MTSRLSAIHRIRPERETWGYLPLTVFVLVALQAVGATRVTEPDSSAADIVSLNAGAAIYVSGVATSLANGVTMAQDAIAAGLANERLQELVRISKLMGED